MEFEFGSILVADEEPGDDFEGEGCSEKDHESDYGEALSFVEV